jgi:phosphatidylserine/phosphatidylglycerophosphate/cardiolipin synthase-like enzyme
MIPLEWICSQFEAEGTISEDSVQSMLEDSAAQQVLLTLNYLAAQRMVAKSRTKGRAAFVAGDLNAVRLLLADSQRGLSSPRLLRSEAESVEQERSPGSGLVTESLVVSVPLSMVGKLRALQASYGQLTVEGIKEAFGRLLAGAQREVFMSVPFLELDGLMVFIDEVRNLGMRQVAVKALTRELIAPGRLDHSYYQKLRAFSKLVDVYISGGGDPELVQVRDYTIKIGGTADRSLLYEGIHQKMIVIDRTKAYVGSGEIRAPSFVVNGDVGVIQLGLAAQFWADYFLLFWSEAQEVEHRFFESARSIR